MVGRETVSQSEGIDAIIGRVTVVGSRGGIDSTLLEAVTIVMGNETRGAGGLFVRRWRRRSCSLSYVATITIIMTAVVGRLSFGVAAETHAASIGRRARNAPAAGVASGLDAVDGASEGLYLTSRQRGQLGDQRVQTKPSRRRPLRSGIPNAHQLRQAEAVSGGAEARRGEARK